MTLRLTHIVCVIACHLNIQIKKQYYWVQCILLNSILFKQGEKENPLIWIIIDLKIKFTQGYVESTRAAWNHLNKSIS